MKRLIPALVVVLALASGFAVSRVAAAPAAPKTIATVSTGDFRVEVSAERRADPSGAPTAIVTAEISRRVGGKWRRRASHRLESTYFWYTVTGPLSMCRLEIRTTAAREGFRPHASIQLLRSPSLGCGPVHRYALT